MSRRLVLRVLVLLLTFVLLQSLLVQLLDLDERWQILQQPVQSHLIFLLIAICLVGLNHLLMRWEHVRLRRWLNRLTVRGKLMWSLWLLTIFPVILLVLLAYWITNSSTERWVDGKVALVLEEAFEANAAISQYYLLDMADRAELFSLNMVLSRRLEAERGIRSIGDQLAQTTDQYELDIYDRDGRRVFSTDQMFLPDQLQTLSIDLSQLSQGDPPITDERATNGYGVVYLVTPIFSQNPALEAPVGAVAISRTSALTQAERDQLHAKITRIRQRNVGRQVDYRGLEAGRPQARNLLVLSLALVALVTLIVANRVSSYLSKSINTPVNALIKGTRHVARGELEYQVDVESQDEFGSLAKSFNRMTRDLQNAAEERKRAEQLAVWRDFARQMAHEIKNPLTPIQLSAQRLRRRYHTNREGFEEVLEQCTQTIEREVASARRWLDEFSQLARTPNPTPHPMDLCQTLQQALQAIPDWPSGIDQQTDWPEQGLQIHADGEQLHRAFFNLIKNALESMDGQGCLQVSCQHREDENQAWVEICDTGPGIPADVLETLFVPHVSWKRDGMGLGLSIVKKIIDDHQGSIEVDTNTERGGTCFRVTLPTG